MDYDLCASADAIYLEWVYTECWPGVWSLQLPAGTPPYRDHLEQKVMTLHKLLQLTILRGIKLGRKLTIIAMLVIPIIVYCVVEFLWQHKI